LINVVSQPPCVCAPNFSINAGALESWTASENQLCDRPAKGRPSLHSLNLDPAFHPVCLARTPTSTITGDSDRNQHAIMNEFNPDYQAAAQLDEVSFSTVTIQ
jgi:hypothetical protein